MAQCKHLPQAPGPEFNPENLHVNIRHDSEFANSVNAEDADTREPLGLAGQPVLPNDLVKEKLYDP